MTKVAMALKELYDAEEELADRYLEVAGQHAAEHDLWYHCKRCADQCHAHAAAIRPFAGRHDGRLPAPDGDDGGEAVTVAVRRKLTELVGRRPESGLLLLRSLRQLYLQAQDVSFHWLIARQLALATRDRELLVLVDTLHRETHVQIEWLEAHVKQASPQALVVGAAH